MVQMMDRRQLPNIGDASVYDVDLTDGQTIRIMVSNVMSTALGHEEAFTQQVAKTIAGRNSSQPSRSMRSFV